MNTQMLVRVVRQIAEEVARHFDRQVVSLWAHVSELTGVESAALLRAYANAVRLRRFTVSW
jgi:hypothetical protein